MRTAQQVSEQLNVTPESAESRKEQNKEQAKSEGQRSKICIKEQEVTRRKVQF